MTPNEYALLVALLVIELVPITYLAVKRWEDDVALAALRALPFVVERENAAVRGSLGQVDQRIEAMQPRLTALEAAVAAKPAATLRLAEILQELAAVLHRIDVRESAGGPLSVPPRRLAAQLDEEDRQRDARALAATSPAVLSAGAPDARSPLGDAILAEAEDQDQIATRRFKKSDLDAAIASSRAAEGAEELPAA